MICHYYEAHNHLLSEQEDCLYCEINALEMQLKEVKAALQQIIATLEDK